jgi:hypothetical protein
MKNEIKPLHLFLVIGASTLLWPLIHYLVFILRFPDGVMQPSALIFAPMGAIAGGFLAYWLKEAQSQQQRLLVVLGYLVASPLAFIGSLGGGLVLSPYIGPTLFGALPLILGCFFGFQLGKRFSDN